MLEEVEVYFTLGANCAKLVKYAEREMMVRLKKAGTAYQM